MHEQNLISEDVTDDIVRLGLNNDEFLSMSIMSLINISVNSTSQNNIENVLTSLQKKVRSKLKKLDYKTDSNTQNM